MPPLVYRVADFTDDFARADSADVGANYTPYTATGLQIISQTLRGTGNADRSEGVTGVTLATRQYAKVTIASGFGLEHFSLLLRGATPTTQNYYEFLVRGGGGNAQLYRVAAGVRTSLAVVSDPGFANGDTASFEANDNVLTCFRNDAAIANLTASDGTYTSGIAGVLIHNQGSVGNNALDNLELGHLVEVSGGTVPQDEMKYLVKLRRGF